jgi:hypothetical protein
VKSIVNEMKGVVVDIVQIWWLFEISDSKYDLMKMGDYLAA